MPMQATTTTPLFSAALKPDGNFRATGGWIAMAISAVMVAPFAVLVPDVALPAALAFLAFAGGLTVLSVRQSRRRRLTQMVTLWADQLEISSTDNTGARTLRRFNPKAVRLVLERDGDEKTLAMRLRTGKEEIELGAFLSMEDRASFARAFGTALRQARQAQ